MAVIPSGSQVYGYIRVSGDEQADRGVPVAGQRGAIIDHCQTHGLALAHLFIDEARVGGNDDRDEFQAMMHLAHQTPAPVRAIVLWSWSRFARNEDDAHFWKASLRRHGVEVVDLSGEVPDVPEFQYIFESLIHWKDAQRREEISHDARRGQQYLAQLGYIPSGCRPPRGYRVQFEQVEIQGRGRQVRRWVPDPELWPRVQQAWHMRLAGGSLKAILQATGLYRSVGCFTTFFTNTAYRGEVRFGGTLIPVEPVVTAEEWARVNANRGQRRGGAYARRQGSRFILSGLLRCGRCGAPMNGGHSYTGQRNDGYERAEWPYYICLTRKNRGASVCGTPYTGARELEAEVVRRLFADVLTPDNMARQTQRIANQREAELPAMIARREDLRAQLARTGQTIERLLDSMELAPASESLAARLNERERQRDRLTVEIAQVEAAINTPPPMLDAAALRRELQDAMDHATPETQRRLLSNMIASIIIAPDGMAIKYRAPFS